jgi:hypothetical protein
MRTALLAAAALAAVAALGYQWLAKSEPLQVPAGAPTAPAQPEPAAPKPAQAEVTAQAPIPKSSTTTGSVVYPDGSKLPALNGVTTEVVLTWGVRPFTKVVGVEDGPQGWKWYVHENGTRSTTVMNTVNGVPQAMGLVAEPERSLPIFPGSLPQGGAEGGGAPK